MSPDQAEQLHQLKDHIRMVDIDLMSIRAAGADADKIDKAQMYLVWIMMLASGALKK